MFAQQHTLSYPVICFGTGLHSGKDTKMTLHPAEEDHGIVFYRSDVEKHAATICAKYDAVSGTQLGTSLLNNEGTRVATIEHLMAALWSCGIDNVLVEINGPEIPIMDGSSRPFISLIEEAGICAQSKSRKVIEILKKIEVREKDKYLSFTPSNDFSINLEIDFGDTFISNQKYSFNGNNVSFRDEISCARTFAFESEVAFLQEQGLGLGGSLDNAIVVGKHGVLNEGGLRYHDEFVRHKLLDCIGDLYVIGLPIKGHCEAFRTGHTLNNAFLRALFADKEAWRMTTLV